MTHCTKVDAILITAVHLVFRHMPHASQLYSIAGRRSLRISCRVASNTLPCQNVAYLVFSFWGSHFLSTWDSRPFSFPGIKSRHSWRKAGTSPRQVFIKWDARQWLSHLNGNCRSVNSIRLYHAAVYTVLQLAGQSVITPAFTVTSLDERLATRNLIWMVHACRRCLQQQYCTAGVEEQDRPLKDPPPPSESLPV